MPRIDPPRRTVLTVLVFHEPAPGRRAADPWPDAHGAHIPVRARVEQGGIDAELGAVRSWLGKRGRVLRRSATRLVVRFEGEIALARIRSHLAWILPRRKL